jgi:hypothetical protein
MGSLALVRSGSGCVSLRCLLTEEIQQLCLFADTNEASIARMQLWEWQL